LKASFLRAHFLDFFKKREHNFFPSDTLIPDDSSVLFTSAGMNQFKPYFIGEKKDIGKAVSCQKCLRTGDLERVGKTAYHHTFFEMLGNFSFGEYFKEEAISLAWEFLTKQLSIKEEQLWVSVYHKDNQAYTIWKEKIKIPDFKIVKLGEGSNFWPADAPSMGPNGPCGPCSEIFFDRGSNKGCLQKICNPDCNCGRFVEIWNLVFTEYDRIGKDNLETLPQKNIDTGMGLERMAAVLQNKDSNFQIDILQPAVQAVREHLRINKDSQKINSLVNLIVDHVRAATFAIGDGVYPSNEERGYVVRKLIRKASWSASLLDKQKVFLYKLPFLFSELMGDFYSEIEQKKEVISKVIKAEEERFCATLNDGKEYLLAEIKKLKNENKNIVGPEELFRFYDTYGFPIELSKEISGQHGLSVDQIGFEKLILQQQERSRKKSMFDECIFKNEEMSIREVSQFCGYESIEIKADILQIFLNYEGLLSGKGIDVLKKGKTGLIILDKTPFYSESGGQLTDSGLIFAEDGNFDVEKVFKVNQAIIHQGRISKGELCVGQNVTALVDQDRRQALARAHTATHLLQAALRRVLGEHVCQQGSLVDEDRLRFDFTHFKSLSQKELNDVENTVNEFIFKCDSIDKRLIPLEDAKAEGVLAFFKDKYKEQVRVVDIGGYSKELCAGTHLDDTSQAGGFVIISESSISSGVRRIEALVGKKAYCYLKGFQNIVTDSAVLIKCDPGKFKVSLKLKIDESEAYRQRLLAMHKANFSSEVSKIVKEKKKIINGICFLSHIDNQQFGSALEDAFAVRELIGQFKKKMGECFLFLVYSLSGKKCFICEVDSSIIDKGLSCKDFFYKFKDELRLKGGGRESFVQGAIADVPSDFTEKLEKCFLKFTESIK